MKQGAKHVYDNKDKTRWHMEYPDGSCKPTPNAASCSSSSSSSSSQLHGALQEELELLTSLYKELQQKHAELLLKYEGLVDDVRLHNQHVDSKNQQNLLSQQNTKMAIHMAAMGPQLTHDEAAKVSAMLISPSPTKKINLQSTPDAEDRGVRE